MFYGGRLLSHLSAVDPEVEDYISLRRLNRNLVILMDSDRGKNGARINETKRRVRGEFDQGLDVFKHSFYHETTGASICDGCSASR